MLNQLLVYKQNLTDDEIAEIQRLHQTMAALFQVLKDTDDELLIKNSALIVESIEYNMQRVWKFKQDRNFHSWWYKTPGCNCPKLDNEDYVGTPYRVFNKECVIHGKLA